MSDVVLLDGVTKFYSSTGGTPTMVLRQVSLTVAAGTMTSIMGPSGSGKSTLLNVLGLMDHASSGKYLLAGNDVSALDDSSVRRLRASAIGFVFQAFHLVGHLNVRDNVGLPLEYAGVGRRERRRQCDRLLEQVGLTHRADASPSTLSGGERQRAAIARAIIHEPHLVLCDEPTGNLDRRASATVTRLLREVCQAQRSVIVVTHDPEVAGLADHRLALTDGVLESG